MPLLEIGYPPISAKISAEKLRLLEAYAELLCNEAMPAGFIGDCTRDELDLRHILDSVLPAIAPESIGSFPLWQEETLNVFDLGAGAGLPSLPLAILFPQHRFFLIDSQEKRCRFVQTAVERLGLSNIDVTHSVVQNFDKPERADVVIFRAFRKILASLELALYVIKSPHRIQSGSGVRPRSLQEQTPAKAPEAGCLTPQPDPVQASAFVERPPGTVALQTPKVLYWRSQSVPFSAEGLKRVADLGYTIESFVKFTSAESILPRGLYTFRKDRPVAKGFPRTWKKISADKLVETES